jgi:predicted DNA-binding protein with PD1-like motif
MKLVGLVALSVAMTGLAVAQQGSPAPVINEQTVSPSRPIPTGLAPGMQVKLVSESATEKVYAVIFRKGDEALSGLTDFAIQYHVEDAHFTAIGAVSGATLGWLDLSKKVYRAIPVREQVEVLSMIGDIATFNGKPVVHAHLVLGKHDGTTVGGHLWEAYVNPTLEVFVTVDATPLEKTPDDASGMKLIDPTKK